MEEKKRKTEFTDFKMPSLPSRMQNRSFTPNSEQTPKPPILHTFANINPESPLPSNPIEIIQQSNLEVVTLLQNSRVKKIYLFDGQGKPTQDKKTAKYMVDTAMDDTEYTNYLKVGEWGVCVPKIFGKTKEGHCIVEWIADHTISGGAGAKPLTTGVFQSMKLDKLTQKPFNVAKWKNTLADVEKLMNLNYSSPDLQFMIENTTGHIYIMDLEANNAPNLLSEPDKRLVVLKELLELAIKDGGPPDSL